jgi:hypothetical protein
VPPSPVPCRPRPSDGPTTAPWWWTSRTAISIDEGRSVPSPPTQRPHDPGTSLHMDARLDAATRQKVDDLARHFHQPRAAVLCHIMHWGLSREPTGPLDQARSPGPARHLYLYVASGLHAQVEKAAAAVGMNIAPWLRHMVRQMTMTERGALPKRRREGRGAARRHGQQRRRHRRRLGCVPDAPPRRQRSRGPEARARAPSPPSGSDAVVRPSGSAGVHSSWPTIPRWLTGARRRCSHGPCPCPSAPSGRGARPRSQAPRRADR